MSSSIIYFPSKRFIKIGKAIANKGQDFTINIRSKKIQKTLIDAKPFLLNDEGEVKHISTMLKLFFTSFRFIVVHFYVLGLGFSAEYKVEAEGEVLSIKYVSGID